MALQANQVSKVSDDKSAQAQTIGLIGFEFHPVSTELDEWCSELTLFTHQCSQLTH